MWLCMKRRDIRCIVVWCTQNAQRQQFHVAPAMSALGGQSKTRYKNLSLILLSAHSHAKLFCGCHQATIHITQLPKSRKTSLQCHKVSIHIIQLPKSRETSLQCHQVSIHIIQPPRSRETSLQCHQVNIHIIQPPRSCKPSQRGTVSARLYPSLHPSSLTNQPPTPPSPKKSP